MVEYEYKPPCSKTTRNYAIVTSSCGKSYVIRLLHSIASKNVLPSISLESDIWKVPASNINFLGLSAHVVDIDTGIYTTRSSWP